jgi:hypothetical protein
VALMHELFDRPVYLEDGTCLDGTRGGQAANAFCPTGPGGGVDPSCGKWASQGGSVTVEEWGHAHGHIFHAEIGGKSVGRAKLYESNSMSELFGKPSFYVSGLHVKDEYRRQGAAKAIYLKILEHIGDAYLVPDFRQTAGASSLWKSLSSLPHVETKEVQANGVTYKGIRLRSAVVNAFCPTGPGGGVDPTCSPSKGEARPTDADKKFLKDWSEEPEIWSEYRHWANTGTGQTKEDSFSENIHETLNDIATRAPRHDGTVYRGEAGLTDQDIDVMRPGAVIERKGWFSTSKNEAVAANFTDLEELQEMAGGDLPGNRRVLMEIRGVGAGRNIDMEEMGINKDQKEVLVAGGDAKMKVISVKDQPGGVVRVVAELQRKPKRTLTQKDLAKKSTTPGKVPSGHIVEEGQLYKRTRGGGRSWVSTWPPVSNHEVAYVRNAFLEDGFTEEEVSNAFCPTGPGGGIDPTCSPKGSRKAAPSLKEFKEKGATKEEISEFNKLNKERSELNKKVKADTATDEERAKRDVVLGRLEDLRMTIRTRYDAGNADKATILDKKTTKKPEAQKDSEKDKAAAEEARKPFFKGEEATLDRMKERLQRRPIGSTEADETHKMMKEMEQDAGDPTVHGMLTSERMKSFKVEGLEVKYPEGARDAAAQTIASVLIGEKLPQKLWDANSTIVFSTQRNKDDAYWAKQYGMPGLKSAATGGDGSIVVYNAESISRGNFAHESGHNLAYKEWGSIYPDATSRYSKAQSVEQPVSPYGSKSHAEDFAEASKIYVDSAHSYGGIVHRRQHGRFLTGKEYLEKEFPLKHAALHEIITGEKNPPP